MALNFNTVELKNSTMMTIRVTTENIQELAESLNGTLDNDIMTFKISKHEHTVLVGDWVVLFDRGRDILCFTDKMFQRLFKSV